MINALYQRYEFKFTYSDKLKLSDRKNFITCMYNDYALQTKYRLSNDYFSRINGKHYLEKYANWPGNLNEIINVNDYIHDIKNIGSSSEVFVEKYIKNDYSYVLDVGIFASSSDVFDILRDIRCVFDKIHLDLPTSKLDVNCLINSDQSDSFDSDKFIRFIILSDLSTYSSYALSD